MARIVEQWHEQRPDLDASPMLVIGRIHRLAQLTDAALRPTFAAANLAPGDFDVLTALRRAGPPHARTAGQLREALMVTSGAVSKQVDRLAGKALVSRDVGADDARVRRITLTDAGWGVRGSARRASTRSGLSRMTLWVVSQAWTVNCTSARARAVIAAIGGLSGQPVAST